MSTAVRNQPITIQIQHDQIDTDRFDLLIDDVVVDSKPVDPAGVNFQFPGGLSTGTFSIVVAAVGQSGSTASDPVTLVVAPGVPSKPVIVIVVG